MIHKNSYVPDQQEDSTSAPDAVADDSNFSGDEAEAYELYTPSPKKRFILHLFTVFFGEFFIFFNFGEWDVIARKTG